MASSNIEQWPAPVDSVAFESLCLDLWKDIWQDSNAQKNGRNGQPQAGVDVFGRVGVKWRGVQCKKKNGALFSKLTEHELIVEIEAAKTFQPPLTEFLIATTASRDEALQKTAREITQQHLQQGLFSVHIWAWEDIWAELYKREALLETIAPQYWGKMYQLKPLKKTDAQSKLSEAEELLAEGGEIKKVFSLLKEALLLAKASKNTEDQTDALLMLSLLSNDRHGAGDTQHYFAELEKLSESITNPASKILFYRAKAKSSIVAKDHASAEEAFQTGLQIIQTAQDDEKRNVADQACLFREAYIHFLCSQKRLNEVPLILSLCESYALQYPFERGGMLLQAALEAGIHYYLEIKDESAVRSRIDRLKAAATSSRLANHIGGGFTNIANQALHRKCEALALHIVQCAIEMAKIADPNNSTGFLVGCFYQEAQILAQSKRYQEAKVKAQSLLSMCDAANDKDILFAIQLLLSEIERLTGNASTSVQLSQKVIGGVEGLPPQVIAQAKLQRSIALSDNGQTSEALDEIQQCWALIEHLEPPHEYVLDVFGHWAHYASQIGNSEKTDFALDKIKALAEKDGALKADTDRALLGAENNRAILNRIRETCFAQPIENLSKSGSSEIRISSLQDVNRKVLAPLLDWWDEGFDALGEIYDYWGRGNFAQLLNNAQKFTGSFNLTLEVRSIQDIKQAVRLWGLYADLLMLIWKGPVETRGTSIVPLSDPYFGGVGGHGYFYTSDEIQSKRNNKTYNAAVSFASTLMPEEVIRFLATEARPFLQSGKLIVVPAPAIGCLHPGHGPFEQLIANAAGAIPNLRDGGKIENPIGFIPYSPDAPLNVLAELADAENIALTRLRKVLRARSHQQSTPADQAVQSASKLLELEIADVLKEIKSDLKIVTAKENAANVDEPLGVTFANYKNLKSGNSENIAYSPLLTLENLGYRWRVGTDAVTNQKIRFEPSEKQPIGTWLASAKCGLSILAVRRVPLSEATKLED
jgi:hypothetical protein